MKWENVARLKEIAAHFPNHTDGAHEWMRECSDFNSEAEAKREAKKRGRKGLPQYLDTLPPLTPSRSLDHAAFEYLCRGSMTGQISGQSMQHELPRIQKFVKLDREIQISAISSLHVDLWLDRMAGLRIGTQRRNLLPVLRFLDWCQFVGVLEENPFRAVREVDRAFRNRYDTPDPKRRVAEGGGVRVRGPLEVARGNFAGVRPD